MGMTTQQYHEIEKEFNDFKEYLKEKKFSEISIDQYTRFVRDYLKYIAENDLEECPESIRRFVIHRKYFLIKSKKWAISIFRAYYGFKKDFLFFEINEDLFKYKKKEAKK